MDYETIRRLESLNEHQEAEVVPMADEIELRPAYEWTCENCGRNQFESVIVIGRVGGDDPADEWTWLMAPDEVMCNNCTAAFGTVDYNDIIEDLLE